MREEVQGEGLRHGGSGGDQGKEAEDRKVWEKIPEMKGQEAVKVTSGSKNGLETEPAKPGRSKRPRKEKFPESDSLTRQSDNMRMGQAGSGGDKVGAEDEEVTEAEEETSQGDLGKTPR